MQCARLIAQYRKTGRVAMQGSGRRRFPCRYTAADTSLLARVDQAHERLSGPATHPSGQSPGYRQRALRYEKTRPARVPIGERRKPAPGGVPGYLRIDTVHRGDGPGGKVLYHLNAVDEVTQWEIVAATPFISETYLLPVLGGPAAPVSVRD